MIEKRILFRYVLHLFKIIARQKAYRRIFFIIFFFCKLFTFSIFLSTKCRFARYWYDYEDSWCDFSHVAPISMALFLKRSTLYMGNIGVTEFTLHRENENHNSILQMCDIHPKYNTSRNMKFCNKNIFIMLRWYDAVFFSLLLPSLNEWNIPSFVYKLHLLALTRKQNQRASHNLHFHII